jgi:hypothetical protein
MSAEQAREMAAKLRSASFVTYIDIAREAAALLERMAGLESWQAAVFDGNAVYAALKPTTLTASDVSNVLDATARVARAAHTQERIP